MREGDTCWNPEHTARWLLPEGYSRRVPRVPFLSTHPPPACLGRLPRLARPPLLSFPAIGSRPLRQPPSPPTPPPGCAADKQPRPALRATRPPPWYQGGGEEKGRLEGVWGRVSPGSCCKTCRGRGVRPLRPGSPSLGTPEKPSRALPWSAGDAARRSSYPLSK